MNYFNSHLNFCNLVMHISKRFYDKYNFRMKCRIDYDARLNTITFEISYANFFDQHELMIMFNTDLKCVEEVNGSVVHHLYWNFHLNNKGDRDKKKIMDSIRNIDKCLRNHKKCKR